MLLKTKGLVLNTINYNDKYNLVPIFTESYGPVTYMVSKAKTRGNKVPKSLFSPLAVLDMEVEHQPSRDIQRIREASPYTHLNGIAADMGKTAMAFFISEFLSRVLKESGENKYLFDYLYQSVSILDMSDRSIANYHLVFMLKLTNFMGFYPNLEEYGTNDYFDMINGEFVAHQPMHRHFLGRGDSLALARLARITFENMHRFAFSRNERVNIINKMLDYYRLHLYDFPVLKSLDVLHELF